jgi:glycosyltransferase involved in cell wall biosynthesis
MISFNHVEFIAQALDSVIGQLTSFEYEIVIGDDCSTDGTEQIIRSYQQRLPGKIKRISRNANVGMCRNFSETLQSSCGEYLALLEGDDYWTDPSKLQLQAEYLDLNRDCAICHHKVDHIAWPSGELLKEYPPIRYRREHHSPGELARFNYIQTCSVMFRRALMPSLDAEFEDLPLGDWPLFALVSEYGWVGYLDRTMAHYRIHSNNTWNNRPAPYKLKAMEGMAWYLRARVHGRSKDLWEDTLLALAFKDIVLAIRAAAVLKTFDKIVCFIKRSVEFRKPFWLLTRFWSYYRSHSV